MAPPTRTPRSAWLDEGLRALADGGPEAVRVEALARALGVTKGGFYNHFADRTALLGELLDAWERLVVDDVIERLEAGGGDGRAKLLGLFELGSSRGRQLVKMELAVRDWARRDKAVARRLKRVDNRRAAYLRSLFAEFLDDEDEVEVRCLVALSLFVGVPSVVADHGPRRRVDVYRQAWGRLVAD